MDIISEFNEKLNYLNERALDFTQLMRILREEYNLNKKCLLYADFENYFNTIFSYLYNHLMVAYINRCYINILMQNKIFNYQVYRLI